MIKKKKIKNISHKKLRIFIPIALILIAGSGVMAFFLSPFGQSFVQAQSISASYQNANQNELKNRFSQFKNSNNEKNNLKIIERPNLSLNAEQEIVNLKDKSFEENLTFNPTSSLISQNEKILNINYQTVFRQVLNEEEFFNAFNQKADADFALKFNLNFNLYNPTTETNISKKWENLITGFSMKNFLGAKTNKSKIFRVFNHEISNQFENVSAKILSQMKIEITKDKKFIFEMQFAYDNLYFRSGFENNQATIKFDQASLHVLFNRFDNNVFVTDYYWPLPPGPIVEESVRSKVPKLSSLLVQPDLYNITKFSPQNLDNDYYKHSYKSVSDFEQKNLNNENNKIKSSNLLSIRLKKEQWETALYNDQYPEGESPTKPGLQVGFDLMLNVFDNDINEVQKYKSFLYGFISADDLKNQRNIDDQLVSSYNINNGRQKNFGLFEIYMSAKLSLNSTLEIDFFVKTLELVVTKDFYVDGNSLDYRFENVTLRAYYDISNPAILAKDLQPRTEFIHPVLQNRYQANIISMNIKNDWKSSTRGIYKDKSYFSAYYSRKVGYYYEYFKKHSDIGSIDISNVTENDKHYADNTYLTFNFEGIGQAGNLLSTYSDTRSQAYQIINYQPNPTLKRNVRYNYSKPSQNRSTYIPAINLASTLDTGKYFQVKVADIPIRWNDNNFQEHLWKTNFSVPIANGNKWINIDRHFDNYDNSYKAPLLRTRYYISLAKSQDSQTIYYKLSLQGTSYMYLWDNSINSQAGSAGFSLRSIDINIDNKN